MSAALLPSKCAGFGALNELVLRATVDHDDQEPLRYARPRRSAFDGDSIKHLRVDPNDRPEGVLWLSDAGAGDGTRTRKGFPPAVFKTAAFAISPLRQTHIFTIIANLGKPMA